MKRDLISLNHFGGNLRGIEEIIWESLGRTFIFKVSVLPHKESGMAIHLSMSSLMDWKMPGPLRLKIFVIGETMLVPKYLIPFVFHIKGVSIRSCLMCLS